MDRVRSRLFLSKTVEQRGKREVVQQFSPEEFEDDEAFEDYPDISEFVQTEFENYDDDESDRGVPSRDTPQAGFYDDDEDDEEEEEDEDYSNTSSLLSSLPEGTYVTTRPNYDAGARTNENNNRFYTLTESKSQRKYPTSALLEQLQTPAYTKPNILSRKLIGFNTSESQPYNYSVTNKRDYTASMSSSPRPLPRLQPRPGPKQPTVSQQVMQKPLTSLESILRKNQRPMPRLQNIECTTTSNSSPASKSLESLMLSHTRSIENSSAAKKNIPRCSVCRKTFATNQVLQRHIASVHGIEHESVSSNQEPHRCRVCYRTFGSLDTLRQHSIHHEGEFKCRACRRGFPSWEVLEQHEATHKKYECRWCEKYFMNSGNLKAHERIHTGERPYKCADCPKGFKQLGGLQYHLKTNPSHRPQKYKLEDQVVSTSSMIDYDNFEYGP